MRSILTSIALILLSSTLIAQTNNVAPVVWERYKVLSKQISVLLPKLPTKFAGYDQCREEESLTYRAYAEGAAYELTISSSRKIGRRPEWCQVSRNKFDRKALEKRLDEIGNKINIDAGTATKIAGLEAFQFKTETATRLLVSDIDANKRWIELEVTHHSDRIPDFERFFGSLQLDATSGKDIGEGSEVTLGDEGTPAVQPAVTPPTKVEAIAKSDAPKSSGVGVGSGSGSGSGPGSGSGVGGGPGSASATGTSTLPFGNSGRYMIVAKEKPVYTDAARLTELQGTVSLKVTLLANGSVGSVVPIRRLPDGLTEKAIYVARRIVFLPKRVNDKPVSISVTIEYSFSIY